MKHGIVQVLNQNDDSETTPRTKTSTSVQSIERKPTSQEAELEEKVPSTTLDKVEIP